MRVCCTSEKVYKKQSRSSNGPALQLMYVCARVGMIRDPICNLSYTSVDEKNMWPKLSYDKKRNQRNHIHGR